MHAPCVSVVLPAFDAAPTLPRAVESIRRQSLSEWELILVNDGSNDATGSIARQMTQDDPRLILMEQTRSGIVAALNRGLASARGTLIARMDADDEAHPDRLLEQVRFLEQNPSIGVVGAFVRFGGNPAQSAGYALHVEWINTLVTPDSIWLNRFVESPFAHPSVMFRRKLLEEYGGYCEGDFPEDYELWLRWLDAGVQMAKVPRELLTWHDSPNRLSRSDAHYDMEAFYRCKAKYLARWLHREVAPERPLLVWGAGRPTRRRADHLTDYGIRISGYIDIDPRKIGRQLSGRPVFAPDRVPPPHDCFVVGYVAKRGARDLARGYLQARGFVEGQDFIMAA